MPEVRPGRYRHYTGNQYTVLGVARHSETLEHEGWIFGPCLRRPHIFHAVAFPEAAVATKRLEPALDADAGAGENDAPAHGASG